MARRRKRGMTLGQGQGELGTGTQTIGSEKMKTLSIGETLISSKERFGHLILHQLYFPAVDNSASTLFPGSGVTERLGGGAAGLSR
jgi:hypothetical protein